MLIQNTVPDQTVSLALLDLGCGLGDLYNYLQKNNYANISYTGLDIVPEMIAAAKVNYPAGNFQVKNFVEDALPEHDIICASGSLNIIFDPAGSQTKHIRKVIQKMYNQSRIACAFNLLNKDSEWLYAQDPRFYYADKQEFYQYCRGLCPDTRLIDGYLVNDFTLVMPRAV
ncbi:MAG: class I SAM-dependent methyltransferase [Candidatus Margulisbacteria bacterium]|jgi:trans-aconitate methyltransferase|nr:class I SAM-dependent methyltransferase [Candidatus Margulisiibacteriota bacterium]